MERYALNHRSTIGSLFIVLVNWNLKDDTLACVASLLKAGAAAEQVLVVDNGSNDGSPQALRERFGPALRVIASEQNLGFAGGANLGIRHALDQGAEWIFILNNDTVVDTAVFVEWERAAQNNPGYAIISPLILYYSDPARIWYLGDRTIPTSLITYGLGRKQLDRGQFAAFVPVDFVCGCGMFVRRSVFEQIGLFDTGFFMYAEEIDFCQRARIAGIRLVCATRARMWHKVSLSADRDRPLTRYLRIRNQILFYRRYAGRLQALPLFAFTLVRALRIGLGDAAGRQPQLVAPLIRGWADGWFGRTLPGTTVSPKDHRLAGPREAIGE
jgi:GT2 family glycosyltransferase